jgi:uncharacterized membrane protein (UPF0182 family)
MRGPLVIGTVIVASITVLSLVGDVLVDWAWFSALGYVDVFGTILVSKLLLFFIVFAATTAFLWLNGTVAARIAPSRDIVRSTQVEWRSVGSQTVPGVSSLRGRHLSHLIVGGAGLFGGLLALMEMGNWDVLLRYLYQVPYGQSDPEYGKDIGFFLFSLPTYIALKNWMLLTVILSALLAGGVYWAQGEIKFDSHPWSVSPKANAHGSILLGVLFAIEAWSFYLDRYLLLYRDNGVVVGASYTDIQVELPILWLLMILALIGACLSWSNLWVRAYTFPVAAVALVLGGSFLLADVLPVVFRYIIVKPNELALEKPYIQRNITLTQHAYGLHQIRSKPFPAEQHLTFQALQANQATIDNIRLWDWQPLMETYRQLQEIRTYFKFHGADEDRYWLGGAYQQVTLSARELDSALLPPNAQTWVNRHVLFTHGNGVVMSAAAQKTTEGLPVLYVQDIPPVASEGPPIREPRIYYGELTDTYVIVKGSTPEFDYPKGKDNVYSTYDGAGGVPIGGSGRRALFAWYFNDPNLMLSDYLTADSRVMFRRNIQERVRSIAPFLRLDHNPYLVINEGRLVWIQDAYTTSDYFPYAQPLPRAGLNYIRNAVKVTIDAYNGTVDFYLAIPSDPVAATYRRIFPDIFKPLEAMPEGLRKHLRYPEDLFFSQAQIYRTYHMDSPEVFYNREDLWDFPRQIADGDTISMAPYYMIMRLPGEPQAEFILMVPMVPSQRDNMIAWLAARCDPPHYGELIAYEFPKEKLVYGPFQIEARINQNTAISQQLALWNQQGSRVIRGNLHVIPIEDSILYVSPLYLRAKTGQIPELKRVIAVYGDQVVMEETLPEALAVLFKGTAMNSHVMETAVESPSTSHAPRAVAEAFRHYNRALERLKTGDWAGFGMELDRLGSVLGQLAQGEGDR